MCIPFDPPVSFLDPTDAHTHVCTDVCICIKAKLEIIQMPINNSIDE